MTNQFLQCRQSVFMGCAGQQLTRLSSITYTISYSLPNIPFLMFHCRHAEGKPGNEASSTATGKSLMKHKLSDTYGTPA